MWKCFSFLSVCVVIFVVCTPCPCNRLFCTSNSGQLGLMLNPFRITQFDIRFVRDIID